MAAATVPLAIGANEEAKTVNPWLIAITVTLATFMELLDTAIANVSLPHIAGGLDQLRREHMGSHQLSRRQCRGFATQRVAEPSVWPQELLHELCCAV